MLIERARKYPTDGKKFDFTFINLDHLQMPLTLKILKHYNETGREHTGDSVQTKPK